MVINALYLHSVVKKTSTTCKWSEVRVKQELEYIVFNLQWLITFKWTEQIESYVEQKTKRLKDEFGRLWSVLVWQQENQVEMEANNPLWHGFKKDPNYNSTALKHNIKQ